MVNDDIASLTSGLSSNNALDGDDLSNVRLLGLEGLERDVGLVKVGIGLEEVLLRRSTSSSSGSESRTIIIRIFSKSMQFCEFEMKQQGFEMSKG